jgi:hypothetical protein
LLTSEQPAKPAVTNPPATSSQPSEKEGTEDANQPGAVADDSADVLALCRLITRILMRILHEHNDHVLQNLFPRRPQDTPQRRNTL